MKKILTILLVVTAVAASAQPDHFITFNGTDQYMRIPHHSDFNIAADQSFTLTGWVRNETYTASPRYVCKRDMSVQSAGDERTGYEFFGTGNAGQSLGLNTPTSTSGHALSVYTGVTIPAGEWMHFALVVDRPNNIIKIYHDLNTNNEWSASANSWAHVAEVLAIIADKILHLGRHPDPRVDLLQEAACQAVDSLGLTQVDGGDKVDTIIALP